MIYNFEMYVLKLTFINKYMFDHRMEDPLSLAEVLGVEDDEEEDAYDPFGSDGLSLPGAGGPGLLGALDRQASDLNRCTLPLKFKGKSDGLFSSLLTYTFISKGKKRTLNTGLKRLCHEIFHFQ